MQVVLIFNLWIKQRIKVEIREASISDLDRIMEIEESAFIPGIREEREVFADRMKTFPPGFLVLEEKGKIWGYFCCELWDEIPDKNKAFSLGHPAAGIHSPEGKVLYVSSYALDGRYRGLGLGKPFFKGALSHMEKSAPQAETLLLVVNEEWKKARHIYETLGFREIRCIPGFFPSDNLVGGASGIVMIRP